MKLLHRENREKSLSLLETINGLESSFSKALYSKEPYLMDYKHYEEELSLLRKYTEDFLYTYDQVKLKSLKAELSRIDSREDFPTYFFSYLTVIKSSLVSFVDENNFKTNGNNYKPRLSFDGSSLDYPSSSKEPLTFRKKQTNLIAFIVKNKSASSTDILENKIYTTPTDVLRSVKTINKKIGDYFGISSLIVHSKESIYYKITTNILLKIK